MTSRASWDEFDALLARVPVDDRAKADLAATMSADDRHYHNIEHLAQLWRRHRRYGAAEGLTTPDIETLIACAIAYHDSVLEIGRSDNEERSAQAWMLASAGSTLAARDREWVAATIRATHDHLAYRAGEDSAAAPDAFPSPAETLRERARAWVLDLDLTPLGDTPENFDRNTKLLCEDAARLTDAQWRAGQLSFLERFYEAPRIYRVPTLAAIYEKQARLNLARQLAALGRVVRQV